MAASQEFGVSRNGVTLYKLLSHAASACDNCFRQVRTQTLQLLRMA